MTTKAILVIMIMYVMGSSEKPIQESYSFRLSISAISQNDEERRFNLELISKQARTEPVKVLLENQVTPYERLLPPGKHTIRVTHIGEKGHIQSTVTGILKGKTKGSASTSSSGATLHAGPSGHYMAVN